MIGTALRLAGQRLLPIVAPAGGRALAKEAARTGALNFALEQGLPRALGQEAPPLPETLVRAATLGALSGPVERGLLAGVKAVLNLLYWYTSIPSFMILNEEVNISK